MHSKRRSRRGRGEEPEEEENDDGIDNDDETKPCILTLQSRTSVCDNIDIDEASLVQ